MEHVLKHKTIYEVLFEQKNIFVDIALMGFAVVFLSVLANITIPLWPVPITMQTFGIFMIAFFFGSRKGALTILLYILAGLLGFGVFAGHKSASALIGPTAGYIIGFVAAVFVVGSMIERGYGRTKSSVMLCMVIGNLIIYAFGIVGLGIFFSDASFLGLLKMGVFPFLIGDAIKIAAAMALFPWAWEMSKRLSSRA
jgi:biotin transport system substrate-specific component